MITTRGNRFFKKSGGGLAWVKHVRGANDLNLNESGGYAFTCRFEDFDARITLAEDDFLLVACQEDLPATNSGEPGGPTRRYRFALLSGKPKGTSFNDDEFGSGVDEVPTPIDEDQLRTAFYQALDVGLVPEHKRRSGRQNQTYMMAVYCRMHYWKRDNPNGTPAKHKAAKAKVREPAAIEFLPARQRKRRIDTEIVAGSDEEEVQEEPKHERPTQKRTPTRKRQPRRPPPGRSI